MVALVENLTLVIFHPLSNVVVRNSFVLVLEGMLTCVRIPSWCNVYDGNVVVSVRNITHISFYSPCNVVVRNVIDFLLVQNLTCIRFHSLHNVVVSVIISSLS